MSLAGSALELPPKPHWHYSTLGVNSLRLTFLSSRRLCTVDKMGATYKRQTQSGLTELEWGMPLSEDLTAERRYRAESRAPAVAWRRRMTVGRQN
jgi:hypothetical protein